LGEEVTARIALTVSPGAARTEVVGPHGEGWKVRVAAGPERGRANKAVVGLVADVLHVPTAAVRVVAGPRSRRKILEIDGLGEEEIGRRLEAAARP
jgi:uncharacterized protein (TIGR00251 family)